MFLVGYIFVTIVIIYKKKMDREMLIGIRIYTCPVLPKDDKDHDSASVH